MWKKCQIAKELKILANKYKFRMASFKSLLMVWEVFPFRRSVDVPVSSKTETAEL